MFTNQITLTSNPYRYVHPNDGVIKMYNIKVLTTRKELRFDFFSKETIDNEKAETAHDNLEQSAE